MPTLERTDDGIFVLNLGAGDNRFNDKTVGELNAALDQIERSVAGGDGPAALVTANEGKIWHNGLDLDWLATIEDAAAFVGRVEQVLGRIMRLPMPTIAAIHGHAFAGGAMLSLAHDHRIMRSDRGYFCLPEVDLGMSFGAGFAAIVAAKVPPPATASVMLFGERIDGPTGIELGIVDATAASDELNATARDLATRLAPKAGQHLATIRHERWGAAIETLEAGR